MLPSSLECLASLIYTTASGNPLIQGFSIDSRNTTKGDLFIALTGARDGHDFIQAAADRGAAAALVSQPTHILPSICVLDPKSALSDLTKRLRDDYAGIVFAITGSQGKTSTRGFLHSILNRMTSLKNDRTKVLVTKGNLNNHLGVPLTMANLRSYHQFALFELGASAVGDIDHLTSLVRPQIAAILNARAAHLDGFGSIEAVIRGKSEIIDHTDSNGVLVLNREDRAFAMWIERAGSRKILSFGQKLADVIWTPLSEQQLHLGFADRKLHINLPTLGKHFMENAAAAAAMAFSIDASDEQVSRGLEEAIIENGRMTPIEIGAQLLIDDTYNASPQSVRSAINWLSSKSGERLLIMGGLSELGNEAEFEMTALGIYARNKGIDRVIAIGSGLPIAEGFGPNAVYIETLNELTSRLSDLTIHANVILVKGSRIAGMDRVVELLKHMRGAC